MTKCRPAAIDPTSTPRKCKRGVLQAKREDIEGRAPTGPRVEDVLTGRTISEEWTASDIGRRRAMLQRFVLGVVVKPGRRGPRGIDPERLDIVTVLDEDPEAREFPWWDLEDDLEVRAGDAARWTPGAA